MTTSITAATGADNYGWLDAIGEHPETTTIDALAAFHVAGAATDITAEQLDNSTFRLQLLGFLRSVAIDGRAWTYELRIPEVPE